MNLIDIRFIQKPLDMLSISHWKMIFTEKIENPHLVHYCKILQIRQSSQAMQYYFSRKFNHLCGTQY